MAGIHRRGPGRKGKGGAGWGSAREATHSETLGAAASRVKCRTRRTEQKKHFPAGGRKDVWFELPAPAVVIGNRLTKDGLLWVGRVQKQGFARTSGRMPAPPDIFSISTSWSNCRHEGDVNLDGDRGRSGVAGTGRQRDQKIVVLQGKMPCSQGVSTGFQVPFSDQRLGAGRPRECDGAECRDEKRWLTERCQDHGGDQRNGPFQVPDLHLVGRGRTLRIEVVPHLAGLVTGVEQVNDGWILHGRSSRLHRRRCRRSDVRLGGILLHRKMGVKAVMMMGTAPWSDRHVRPRRRHWSAGPSCMGKKDRPPVKKGGQCSPQECKTLVPSTAPRHSARRRRSASHDSITLPVAVVAATAAVRPPDHCQSNRCHEAISSYPWNRSAEPTSGPWPRKCRPEPRSAASNSGVPCP